MGTKSAHSTSTGSASGCSGFLFAEEYIGPGGDFNGLTTRREEGKFLCTKQTKSMKEVVSVEGALCSVAAESELVELVDAARLCGAWAYWVTWIGEEREDVQGGCFPPSVSKHCYAASPWKAAMHYGSLAHGVPTIVRFQYSLNLASSKSTLWMLNIVVDSFTVTSPLGLIMEVGDLFHSYALSFRRLSF